VLNGIHKEIMPWKIRIVVWSMQFFLPMLHDKDWEYTNILDDLKRESVVESSEL